MNNHNQNGDVSSELNDIYDILASNTDQLTQYNYTSSIEDMYIDNTKNFITIARNNKIFKLTIESK